MYPLAKSCFLGSVQHSLNGVGLSQGSDVAAIRCEIERRRLHLRASNQHIGIGSDGLNRPHDQVFRAQAPMLRATLLRDQLHSALSPGDIAGKAKAAEDDFVHLIAEQEFRERELPLPSERANGFVPNGKQDAARHRFLVVLDLSLEV